MVSVSGATATGKSTLIKELQALAPKQTAVERTTSCSMSLFERWHLGKIPFAPPPVATFDQIDATPGCRSWFQRHTPSSLTRTVEEAAHILALRGRPSNLLLVDRWFPDIVSFTRTQAPIDKGLHAEVRELCRDQRKEVFKALTLNFDVRYVSVFIPVSSCQFKPEGQDGKFRATTDRAEWESVCLAEWEAIEPRPPLVTIKVSEVDRRVFHVGLAVTAVGGLL